MRFRTLTAALLALALAGGALAGNKKVYLEDGQRRVRLPEVDQTFKTTPWPGEMEHGFWERANHAIDAFKKPAKTATTGEHEKWNYPALMFNYLAGLEDHAIAGLQQPDQNAGDHKGTAGIDWYWCFTIKNQTRKYFYFQDLLKAPYRKKMYEGARLWTAEDPKPSLELVHALYSPDAEVRQYALKLLKAFHVDQAALRKVAEKSSNKEFRAHILENLSELSRDPGTQPEAWMAWWKAIAAGDWKVYEEYERILNPRPHPVYGHGSGPVGATWDPKVRGLWVDARNTDNLRSMRETTIYLMAEETGNETVRKLYKNKLRFYVRRLYTVGMGEWDSETYHAHTIAPWLNLYDFAKDPEVKKLAKASLDWLFTAGAVKYYRGGFGGPNKRDYGGANKPFGAGVTHMLYLYFGDTPMEDPDPHYDDVHAITSAYRPPLAVVGLAHKAFPRPVELRATKPTYSHFLPGAAERPEFWETQYFGKTFQLGTVVARGGSGDVGPWKLMAYNSKVGVDFVVAFSGKRFNTMRFGDQVSHARNLVVHLRPDAKVFSFKIPKTATVEQDDDVTFVKLERTHLAIRPINMTRFGPGQLDHRARRKYPDATVLSAKPAGGTIRGYALEIGEGDYGAFKRAVTSKGKLDLSQLGDGTVRFTGSDGRNVQTKYNTESNLPILRVDGKLRDWDDYAQWKPVGADGPVVSDWKDGKLTVTAGGYRFTQTVAEDGSVTWSEEKTD